MVYPRIPVCYRNRPISHLLESIIRFRIIGQTIDELSTDKMIAAAATAVGINMTFLLPYSMLRKGWGREHRGLASFDLGIGLFVPFFLATTCVMIASASQFHGKFDEGLIDPNKASVN